MNYQRCPRCGQKRALVKERQRYNYKECGLDNVWLEGGGVLEITCNKCHKSFITILKEWQLLQVIALSLLLTPKRLTGPEVKYLRKSCGLTQGQLAKLLGVTRPTISAREAREGAAQDVGAEVKFRIVLLRQFEEFLNQPGNDYLAPEHREQLDRFRSRFYDLAEKILSEHEKGRPRIRISKESEKETWGSEVAVA